MPFWKTPDFLSICSLLLGLASLFAGVFLYFKGKSKSILKYRINSTVLLTPEMIDIPGFKVTIHDKPISDLISTRIWFGNKGNQAIVKSSFPPKAPLRLTIDGIFYGARCTAGDEDSGLFIENSKQEICIYFDYLAVKSGFTITVWHTGLIGVSGKLINGKLLSS